MRDWNHKFPEEFERLHNATAHFSPSVQKPFASGFGCVWEWTLVTDQTDRTICQALKPRGLWYSWNPQLQRDSTVRLKKKKCVQVLGFCFIWMLCGWILRQLEWKDHIKLSTTRTEFSRMGNGLEVVDWTKPTQYAWRKIKLKTTRLCKWLARYRIPLERE